MVGRLLWLGLAFLLWSCSGSGGTGAGSTAASPGGPPAGAPPEIDRVTALPDPLPQVSARVNDQPIPLRNVRVLAEQAIKAGEDKRFAYRQGMHQCIVRELLFQEALARGLTADSERVQQAYDESRVEFKDDKTWTAFLAKEGLDPQTFKAELRTTVTIQLLIRQEMEKLPPVTDAEAEAHFNANPAAFETGQRLRASHILIRVPEGASAARKTELRAKAEKILARIRRGEDFAKLAGESSEDPGSAGKGGRLDDFGRGDMVAPFEKAAYALSPGQVSDLVESPFGFHVIKLHERLPSQRPTFQQAKESLKQHLTQKRQTDGLQGLVNALRGKAKIETFL